MHLTMGFPGGTVVKNPPANARDERDTGLIPGSRRSPGEENGNLLQYSCLENPRDRGAWWARVHRVEKSRTPLSMHAWSNIFAWKIPWTEEPGELQPMRPHRVGHDWVTEHTTSENLNIEVNTDWNGKINSNTIIVEVLNTLLSIMARTCRQKSSF